MIARLRCESELASYHRVGVLRFHDAGAREISCFVNSNEDIAHNVAVRTETVLSCERQMSLNAVGCVWVWETMKCQLGGVWTLKKELPGFALRIPSRISSCRCQNSRSTCIMQRLWSANERLEEKGEHRSAILADQSR